MTTILFCEMNTNRNITISKKNVQNTFLKESYFSMQKNFNYPLNCDRNSSTHHRRKRTISLENGKLKTHVNEELKHSRSLTIIDRLLLIRSSFPSHQLFFPLLFNFVFLFAWTSSYAFKSEHSLISKNLTVLLTSNHIKHSTKHCFNVSLRVADRTKPQRDNEDEQTDHDDGRRSPHGTCKYNH